MLRSPLTLALAACLTLAAAAGSAEASVVATPANALGSLPRANTA